MDNASTYIVIPAHNEASVIRATVEPLIAAGYTVVVVDDGSTDGTAEALDGLPIVRLHHAVNLGAGAATETGVEYARRNGAEFVVHFDADGQHDAQQIPAMLAPLREGRADVVLGSRFMREEDRRKVPPARRLLLRAAVLFSAFSTRLPLTDAHIGFRAFSRRGFEAVRLREPGFAHGSEIPAEIHRLKLRWVEVPASVRYTDYSRQKGQSGWNAINILIDLVVRRVFR